MMGTILMIVIPLAMLAVTEVVWDRWTEKRFWRAVCKWIDKSKKPVFINPEE